MSTGGSHLSRSGFEKLRKELEQLKTVKRREISKAIGAARAHGDISENAEYDAAKEAQGLNEKKISELEHKLASAQMIDEDNMSKDEVLIGAIVKLKNLKGGADITYTVVSEEEADFSEGKISISSPVGNGLMNHKVGDTVEIVVPAGVLKYKILSIDR